MFDYEAMFKNSGKTRQELALALDTAAGTALIPEDLEKILVDLVKWNAPFTRMIQVIRANGLAHQFNQITGIPDAQFEGENATTGITNSTYVRASVTLKVMRVKGRVTGLMQDASAAYINAWKQEILNSTKAMGRNIEFAMLWGDATADVYQYDGADLAISTNRIDHNAAGSLGLLDDMLDRAYNQGAQMDPFIFVMSPQMVSRMSGLQTQIRKSVTTVEFPGGFRMTTYRDVPMLPSSFCRPSSQMAALVLAASTTGTGGLAAGEVYRYRMAAVTYFGEQSASANQAAHTVAGAEDGISVTWTAVAGAQSYKIYRTPDAGAAGAEVLLIQVAAKTYDGSGTVTGTVTNYVDELTDASLQTDKPYDIEVAGTSGRDETIFLVDISKDQSVVIAGLINQLGEKVNDLVQHIQLARITDALDFLLFSYHAPAWKGEQFSSIARRVRSF